MYITNLRRRIYVYVMLYTKTLLTFSALQTAFDEKTLFPKFVLDYENEMKKALQPTTTNPSVSFLYSGVVSYIQGSSECYIQGCGVVIYTEI